jgi:hypothetical protein
MAVNGTSQRQAGADGSWSRHQDFHNNLSLRSSESFIAFYFVSFQFKCLGRRKKAAWPNRWESTKNADFFNFLWRLCLADP